VEERRGNKEREREKEKGIVEEPRRKTRELK
jgi:hypothetical protein